MVEGFTTQLPLFWFNALDSAAKARIGETSHIWGGYEAYQKLLSAPTISAYQLQSAITLLYEEFGYQIVELFNESAEYLDELDLGAPVLAILTAPNLKEFCQLLSRYSAYIHPLLNIFCRETKNDELELWTVTPEYIDEQTLMTHMSLGLYFSIVLRLIRRYMNAPFHSFSIHVNKITIGDEFINIYEKEFNVDIKEGYPARYFLFDAEVAGKQYRRFQPKLHSQLKALADEQFSELLNNDLVYQVNKTFGQFVTAEISQEGVANELHISTRTLNRKLQQQGVTFKHLYDKYRLQLSLTMLNQNTVNITQIAHELGFSDSSAFSRAFRRWTGHSPTEQRN